MKEFDYRLLLIKYIDHIIRFEGISFIDDIDESEGVISKEEKEELDKLSYENV